MKYESARFELAAAIPQQLPPSELPEIVFSGRSNVGKSSLINKLLNRKALARVSSQPGKTITINFYDLTDGKFVDLPGYGYAKISNDERMRFSNLIDFYFSQQRNIRLVIQLIDFRHPPSRDDITMTDYLMQMGLPFVIILTKSDKLNKSERAARLKAFPGELGIDENVRLIPFSAMNGEGADELRSLISSLCD